MALISLGVTYFLPVAYKKNCPILIKTKALFPLNQHKVTNLQHINHKTTKDLPYFEPKNGNIFWSKTSILKGFITSDNCFFSNVTMSFNQPLQPRITEGKAFDVHPQLRCSGIKKRIKTSPFILFTRQTHRRPLTEMWFWYMTLNFYC